MANIFNVFDPNGKSVYCTDDRWNNHILTRHSELKQREKEVIKTIESPDAIFQDFEVLNKNYYYRLITKTLYLKVVVNLEDGNKARVITAHLSDSIRPKEKCLWMKSKQV